MCKYKIYKYKIWTPLALIRRTCFILAIFIFPHPLCDVWDVALVLHLLTIEVKKKKKRKKREALSDVHT